ncbi:FG-GAP repeat domain-containing protein [Legionella gresilensis]|uniref:FG-GAP repeat domain-containing protein n=1 Tax=Legionella gresilensis TaxID=91823 RepID=UPI001040F565|nr:VCBS repeat-containing protein [Legionella gresilensis]
MNKVKGFTQYYFLFSILLFTTNQIQASKYHTPHTSAPLNFKMSIIDAKASGSYGLIGQDITQNGFTDLVSFAYSGISEGQPEGEIYWYEFQPSISAKTSPTWKKHLITKKKHVVHGMFMDVDQDGLEDLVFMSDFEVPIKQPEKEGNIWWAKRPKDLNVKQWETYWIGQTPGAHRIITADLQGTGQKQVIVIPLFGPGERPIYGAASITLYTPNSDIKRPWKKIIFENNQYHVMHDAIVVPKKQGEKGENILIAAKEGLIKLSFYKDGDKWVMDPKLLHSSPKNTSEDESARDKGVKTLDNKNKSDWKFSGLTSLSKFDSRASFIATIDYTSQSSYLNDEPWHGDTVTIYKPQNDSFLASDMLERKVLEKRSAGGHAVQIADLTGRGCFDIIAGYRSYPTALVLYLCKQKKLANGDLKIIYQKQILSERSANSIVIGNWSKNGLPDLATAGYGNEGDPYILMWLNQNSKMKSSLEKIIR